MIGVEIFTHSDLEFGGFSFERGDLRVAEMTDGDSVSFSDMEMIFNELSQIDENELAKDEWYLIRFNRKFEDDGSGAMRDMYFEFIEAEKITESEASDEVF